MNREIEMNRAAGAEVSDVLDAATIPPLSHAEAMAMARVELDRFLALLDSLTPDEWNAPTACTRWNVRQVVAHLLAFADAATSFAEFRRQGSRKLQRPYRAAGMSNLDAMNQLGVDERDNLSPNALITQLRACGPRAIRTRERLPGALRHLPLPMGLVTPEIGRTWVPLSYLVDTILTRDMWMHRLDISRATGRRMILTPDHDGRVTALVVRDLSCTLCARLPSGVMYDLAGHAGGTWKVGSGTGAVIHMDALDFHLLASGRLSAGTVRPRVTLEGDSALGSRALEQTVVPY